MRRVSRSAWDWMKSLKKSCWMVAEGTSYRADLDLSRADLSRAKSAWLSLRERSEVSDLRNSVRCSCWAITEVVEEEVEGKNVFAWSWSRSAPVMC